jgi:hypothetical protein
MTAGRGIAIASAAVATTIAVALATSGRAETAGPSKLPTAPTATPTTSRPAARERPTGVVLDCSTQSGIGAGSRQFKSRWNLAVGPLAITAGAGATPEYSPDVGGNKFPLLVRAGHRVTVEISRRTRRGAGLAYGSLPVRRPLRVRDAHRVVRFIACRRGERSRGSGEIGPSFWAGGVVARSPRCVPLFIWVDDEPSPRRAVIRLGVRRCG